MSKLSRSAVYILGGVAAPLWVYASQRLLAKPLTILGERGVGKTHLAQYLEHGSVPTATQKTSTRQKSRKISVKIAQLSYTLRTIHDLPGDKDFYGQWEESYNASEYIFYLVRADKLFAGDTATERRIRNDAEHMSTWRDALPNSKKTLIVVGTFADKDPSFNGAASYDYADYKDRFSKIDVVREFISRNGGLSEVRTVVGSMVDATSTKALVERIEKELSA